MSEAEQEIQDGESLVAAIEAESPEEKEAPAFDYEAHQEELASKGGWKPLEDWVADGKDPSEWSDAKTFNVRGEFIGKLRQKDKELEETVTNLNKFHSTQLTLQRSQLEQEKAAAIAKGGAEAVEEVKNIDFQLDQLNQPVVSAPQKDDLVANWEAANPWIDEPGAKSVYAQTLFGQAQQSGMSTQAALQHVNQGIAREFPAERKATASMSEGGSRPTGKAPSGKAITMSDLTAEEKEIRSITPEAWKSDEDFLKAVAAARK